MVLSFLYILPCRNFSPFHLWYKLLDLIWAVSNNIAAAPYIQSPLPSVHLLWFYLSKTLRSYSQYNEVHTPQQVINMPECRLLSWRPFLPQSIHPHSQIRTGNAAAALRLPLFPMPFQSPCPCSHRVLGLQFLHTLLLQSTQLSDITSPLDTPLPTMLSPELTLPEFTCHSPSVFLTPWILTGFVIWIESSGSNPVPVPGLGLKKNQTKYKKFRPDYSLMCGGETRGLQPPQLHNGGR